MANITAGNINVAGALVRLGGTIITDTDNSSWYDVSPQGTDVGCTQGGVTVTYSLETSDIFCDQLTSPIHVAITAETATVEFSMLESTAENMKLALSDFATAENDEALANAYWLGVGGVTTITFIALELEITDNDTGYLTTWTFFRCVAGGIEANFERENPTAFGVTFTAYADTDRSSGKQLFQVRQNAV